MWRAGLVRRGDPGRRGRARDGPRRQDRLRRGGGLPQRPGRRLGRAIDNHVANVITNSWTDGTDDINLLGSAYVDFYQQFSLEAALTGITVNFSSGDSGDHTAGGTDLAAKTVEFPADLPYVTGVGGTSVLIGSQGQWLGEYGWQNAYSTLTSGAWTPAPPGTYTSGGGGGTSQLFAQPFYQAGKVPASISEYYGSTPMRAVPDISMAGDPNTGFEVGETQVFPDGTYWAQYRIGGTSLSSPLMAGVVAVADQSSHRSLGLHQPAVLQAAGHPGAARHRRADVAAGAGPHRLRQLPRQLAGLPLPAADGRRADLDPARHPRVRRRNRGGHAQRSGVLHRGPAWVEALTPRPGAHQGPGPARAWSRSAK